MNLSKHLLIICLLFFNNVIFSKDKSLKRIEFSKEEINYLNKVNEDVVYIDQATKQTVNRLYKNEMIKNPGNSLLQFCQACQDNWKIVPMRVAQEASKELDVLIERNKDKFTEERYKKLNSTIKNYQVNLQSKDAQFFFASNKAKAVNATRTFNNLVVSDTLQVNNLFRVNQNGTLGVRVGNDPAFASGRVVSNLPVRINFTPTDGSPNSLVVVGTTVLDNLVVRTNQTVRGNLNVEDNITIKGTPVIFNADNMGNGIGIFKDKSGNILNFKSLVAGSNIAFDTSDENQITISALGSSFGDVRGPSSATDNAITRFDGTTGKLIQNSAGTIDDSGNISTSGQVTATQFNGPLNGNATSATIATTAVTATAATNFTGSLSGDVTGTQSATVVSLVGGKTAAQVSSTVNDVDAATSSNVGNTLVLRDLSGNFSSNQITATQFNGPLNGNATSATTAITAVTATTATNFTGSLSGDVTGTQGATVVSTVGGKTAAQVASTVNTVDAATDASTASTLVLRDSSGNFSSNQITATQFNGPLNGNATSATTATTAVTASTATNFTGSLLGDVTGTQGATVVSTVGGKTAAQVASTVNTVDAATDAPTASTLVLRDSSGNFSSNQITATQFNGPLNGNATSATTATTATTAVNATNFTGSLSGDVTGTQSATVVSLVGGKTATEVASTVDTVDAATDASTASTLVLRDSSGNFSSNQITATQLNGPLNGNATSATTATTATTAVNATNFTGSLSGDVTGTQGATVVSTVGGKTAAQVASTVNTVDVATDAPTASTLVLRDSSGNFSSNQITATQFNGPLNGNATSATTASTATTAVTATNFTGSLSGDVTGTQSATVVSTIGGVAPSSSATPNAVVLRDSSGNFSSNQITATQFNGPLNGNATSATTATTATTAVNATNFTGSLLGDVTGTQSATVVSTIGGIAPSSNATPNAVVLRDSSGDFSSNQITATQFNGPLNGNATSATTATTAMTAVTATNFTGSLSGDVTGTQSATVVSTIGGIAPSSSSTPNAVVLRDSSGNFSSNQITATQFNGPLNGNATSATTATTATTAVNFTGSLSGNVTGTQNATVVSLVGGKTAAEIDNTVDIVDTATSASIANSLVLRDVLGDFSANQITATQFNGSLNGNATSATTATTATNFTGSLSGDVSGAQSSTVVDLIGGKTAAEVASTVNAVNSATSLNTPNTLVLRDNNGNFTSNTINLNAHLNLTTNPSTLTAGQIRLGGSRFVHNLSSQTNFFGGISSGNPSSTGNQNTGVGAFSLSTVGTGASNTAVGYLSLSSNTTGSNNTGIGTLSMSTNSTGSQNTAIGMQSAQQIGGNNNVAVGYQSLTLIGTGNNNTAVGTSALAALNGGSQNTALGYQAGINLNGSETQNIYISSPGVVGDSNTTRIGVAANQTKCFISGIRGVTTGTADAVPVLIDSNGQLGTISSSIRYKKDIKSIEEQSDKVVKLNPVSFKYKTDKDDKLQYGLIAEEVEKVLPELVIYKDGKPETVQYQFLPILLLDHIRKMEKRIRDLEANQKS